MRSGLNRTIVVAAAALGAAAWAGAAGAADAATRVDVRDAAARVTLLPENRTDVVVNVVRTNPRLPLFVTQAGDSVRIDGRLGWRVHGCHTRLGQPSVGVMGVGDVRWDELPQIVVHTPLDVRVGASGAVWGVIGRSGGVDLGVSGCGDWTVADTAGNLRVGVSGSGDVHAGAAATADVHVAGSGDVFLTRVAGGLASAISGSGDVTVGQVNGPLKVRIAGSGDFKGQGGEVSDMNVAIAGSGDATFHGVAQTLTASVAGSGDVNVARVAGAVTKHVAGSGEVTAGR